MEPKPAESPEFAESKVHGMTAPDEEMHINNFAGSIEMFRENVAYGGVAAGIC